jgi:hypothetical protein
VLVVATPTGNQFFSTVALSADLWVLAIGLSAVGFVAIVRAGALFARLAAEGD